MNREEGQSGNFQSPLSGRIAGSITDERHRDEMMVALGFDVGRIQPVIWLFA